MWNGKMKAVTFSFDDGVTQDIRTIEILNKYGLRGTFNLNSALLGLHGTLERNGKTATYNKIEPRDVRSVYEGHEVAVHTLSHPPLLDIPDETLVFQTEEDRLALSELAGYEVVGMAYPFGHCNEHIANVLREKTGVKYSRTVKSTKSFDLQNDLLLFNPSVYFIHADDMFSLGEKFIELKCTEPKLFYIWGHTYEMDADYISWEKFEEFCRMISGKDDIFYGTNKEILL